MKLWSLLRPSPNRDPRAERRSRRKALAWLTAAGVVFGLIEFGEPVENMLRDGRDALARRAPSGNLVIVGIDDRSLQALGSWPWPRSQQAKIVDKLRELGARRVFFDIFYSAKSLPHEDKAFADALRRWKGRATIAASSIKDGREDRLTNITPLPIFARQASIASVDILYDYKGVARSVPYSAYMNGLAIPSISAKIAGTIGKPGGRFPIDYSIDLGAIPTVSAVDVVSGKILSRQLQGKDVLVGTTSRQLGDRFFVPGYGRVSGVFLHALGAETLAAGSPKSGGWFVVFLAALALTAWALQLRSLRVSVGMMAGGALSLCVAQFVAERSLFFVTAVPALFLLVAAACWLVARRMRQSFRARGTTNLESGLGNLDGLRGDPGGSGCTLVVARIGNFAQLAATLPAQEERLLVEQIAKRLTLGDACQALYQGDEGIFAWFVDDAVAVGEHLEGLHGFFRSPIVLAGREVDLAVSFGVDASRGRSISNRLGSALVAAEEAAGEGLKWKLHDPATLEDADWKLSLLGQLDRAIESGDLWVAYQGKLDLRSGRICGAEALVRWTHPTKGAIAPLDFILAAEQSDRIERLTRFVLNDAIKAAAEINKSGSAFNVAVNLSTRLLDDAELPTLVAGLLRDHGLRAECLTLEVTETAAMASGGANIATLDKLRALGVQISIDDYGTGLSTLEYLKTIPATEIKIDQSFVAAITKSRSDCLMVHSTIQLVHSLGQKVVAEGVEDRATLDALKSMGCDYAQGFLIDRPMTLKLFREQLSREQDEQIAVSM